MKTHIEQYGELVDERTMLFDLNAAIPLV